MDIALGLLKLAALIFAILLVPVALVLVTPFVLLWPPPEATSWGQAVRSRYRRVIKGAWAVSALIDAAIPD